MKKLLLLLVIALLIIGCGANEKKSTNNNSGKQTGIANATNDTQTNVVLLKKRRNFKGLVSPFMTKSPFEGIWIAEVRDANNIFAYILLIEKVYDDDYTKKYIEIYLQTSKYEGFYNQKNQNVVYTWKKKNNGRYARWEINDYNENSNYYQNVNKRGNETWTYNANNDTVQMSFMGFRNNIHTITYKRFNENELQRIKQNAKNDSETSALHPRIRHAAPLRDRLGERHRKRLLLQRAGGDAQRRQAARVAAAALWI